VAAAPPYARWAALIVVAGCGSPVLLEQGEPRGLVVTDGVTCVAPASRPIVSCVGRGFGPRPVVIGAADGTGGVAVGAGFGCALDEDGAVSCWGNGDRGQLGRDVVGDHPPTVVPVPSSVQVVAGRGHACSLDGDGAVWCWGDDGAGQLGDGGGPSRWSPAVIAGVPPMRWLAAEHDRTCGLTVDGAAWCWGPDRPAAVDGLSGLAHLVVAPAFVCGLDAAGAAVCAPEAWGAPGPFVGLASGDRHLCGVDAGGAVRCWGEGPGVGPTASPEPSLIVDLPRISSVAAGGDVSCAAEASGVTWCWGKNGAGQLGLDVAPAVSGPVAPKVTGIDQIEARGATTCAMRGDVGLCWGGSRGALPVAVTPAPVYEPDPSRCVLDGASARCGADVIPLPPVTAVDGTAAAGCGIARDGVWCWGLPLAREGGAPTDPAAAPEKIARVRGARSVAVGDRHACALLKDGTVRCWGASEDGRLGTGTSDLVARPVRVRTGL
jgi:alpha-tubulin suppressor-like RCC1 family protein